MNKKQLASAKIDEFLNKCQNHYNLSDKDIEEIMIYAQFKRMGIVYIQDSNGVIYKDEEYYKTHEFKEEDLRSIKSR